MMRNTLCKVIQRKTYSCLSHRHGIYFAYSGIIIVLYSMFHFGEELMEWSRYHYEVAFSVYHDNVMARSFQHRLCSDLPIDIVYTWVNGSDPLLISQFNKYRKAIQFNSSSVSSTTSLQCNYKDCILVPLIIVSPLLENKALSKISNIKSTFQMELSSDGVKNHAENVTLIRLPSLDSTRESIAKFNITNHTAMWFHATTDSSASGSMFLPHALVLKTLPVIIKTDETLLENLPEKLKEELDWLYMSAEKHIALLWFKDESVVNNFMNEKSNSSIKSGFKIDGTTVTASYAYFVPINEEVYDDTDIASKSRFEDNEELRYSLRSIEKYAPWVHHIFIVTNGQIPSWLNMDSPHVTLVTHEDIFPNKSHLPTFSSPAIEAHIHRIPGLANRFIYFNDDVMFGKEVWPDDFYTHSSGQKVYLTWPVPNCAEGCAPSWIKDSYCDAACNVSECNWDGGDCIGSNIKPGVGMSHNMGGNTWHSNFLMYCKPGCSNTWLADKFCDQACNTYECGFDAGDCGLDNFKQLPRITTKRLKNNTIYQLRPGKHVGYIDLTKTFSKVTHARCLKNNQLRTAAVSNKFRVLTMLFAKSANKTEISFNITGFPANQSNAKGNEISFQNHSITILFKVKAFPSKNDTVDSLPDSPDDTDADDDDDGKEAKSVSKGDDIPEVVFIDIPEDMKNPAVAKRLPPVVSELPFSLDQVNRSLLSENLRKQLEYIEKDYKEELITDIGFKLKLYNLLEPHFDVLIRTLTPKGETLKVKGEAQNIGDGPILKKQTNITVFAVHAEKDVMENSHSHIKGDPGIDNISRKKVAHQMSFRKDPPFLEKIKPNNIFQETNRSNSLPQRFGVKTRKLNSIELNQQLTYPGFFPWERDEKFRKELKDEEKRLKVQSEYQVAFKGRRLLDTFGDSLRFVSNIYNRRFGFSQRKVPAHMPHMIDKSIMLELQSEYPHEYDMTSSHKLRHPQDMQFAFSYFYFLMSEEISLNYSQIFDDLDTDQSGVLSDREIRLLATRLFELPLTLQELTSLEDAFKQCGWQLYGTDENLTVAGNISRDSYSQPISDLKEWAKTEKYYDNDMPFVTKEIVINCPFVMELINKSYTHQKKYKYQEMDQSEIAFKMIRDNVTTVVGQLDDIRKSPKKFICLNDNIDHDLPQAPTIKAVIRDFYETMFPLRSQFELPYDYKNRFTHMHQLLQWKDAHERTLRIMHILLGFLLFCVILSFFWDSIHKKWRKYRYIYTRRKFFREHCFPV